MQDTATESKVLRFVVRQDGKPVEQRPTYDEALAIAQELKRVAPEMLVTVWDLAAGKADIILPPWDKNDSYRRTTGTDATQGPPMLLARSLSTRLAWQLDGMPHRAMANSRSPSEVMRTIAPSSPARRPD